MLIGYARTSTTEQEAGFEAQIRDLEKAGCDEIYKEQVSSVDTREELEAALKFIRKGDTLVVTTLDRLARSTRHLGEILDTLKEKKAHLKILDLGVDTSSATGELVLSILGAVAQFERKVMLERQREGIAKAKAQGRYKGRQPTARAKSEQVLQLKKDGRTPTEIARELKIGRSSVYRILNSAA